MKLENNNNYIDKYCLGCRGKKPLHDIKVNIRKNSVFEDLRTPKKIIHYLAFHCFLKRICIKKSLNIITDFFHVLKIDNAPNKL